MVTNEILEKAYKESKYKLFDFAFKIFHNSALAENAIFSAFETMTKIKTLIDEDEIYEVLLALIEKQASCDLKEIHQFSNEHKLKMKKLFDDSLQ